jgi:DNA-binding CsgD family transcriptional regulator
VGDDVSVSSPTHRTNPATDLVAAAGAALAKGRWEDARAWFGEAVARAGAPEAYEGLSWAAWWLDDAEAMFEARERAYRLYRAAGRLRDAARMALWLGGDAVDFRGEVALAKGWFNRARRLLDGLPPSAELGWLCVHEAEKIYLLINDPVRVRQLGAEAAQLGRQLDVASLEMMGLATKGMALVMEGAVEEGIAHLGEATTVALTEDVELWAAGWCLCYMVFACEHARDYELAVQWCRTMQDWTERRGIQFLNRVCRAHYAGILIWQGTWTEAEQELIEAAARLAESRPPMAAEAVVRLGDLRRRQGRLVEAREILQPVAEHPQALLGLGELCLDQDDPAGARDRADEYLRDTAPQAATVRAAGLELLARACAALGDIERAREATEELAGIAAQVPTNPLRASASLASGTLALAEGEHERARTAFEDAVRLFLRSGAPFETGRARLALAYLLRQVGRDEEALRQARAAALDLGRVGAAYEAERSAKLVRDLERAEASATSLLTGREGQVLGLVAEGKTNRAIAQALVLSEHTVNRHVTNILAKLGTGSRSAAVAEALRRKLI